MCLKLCVFVVCDEGDDCMGVYVEEYVLVYLLLN